ncbi:MAG: hypothetical protein QXH43_09285 [Metallosphaera sp.]|uniref:hypothetical protein n=1 Tax=Metallosphaera sp. TaxID=2020860 RepID=UPI00317129F5
MVVSQNASMGDLPGPFRQGSKLLNGTYSKRFHEIEGLKRLDEMESQLNNAS